MEKYNREWYGDKAKVVKQSEDCTVIDYGCKGHGIVTSYYLFDGIQLCFLDFDAEETMSSQNKIGETLGIDKCWYLSITPSKLQHLFSEIYEAQGLEQIGYFKIKAIELLYHIDQLTQNKGCDFKYFDRGQIQTTKQIRNYLVAHLEERTSLEELAKEAHINLSLCRPDSRTGKWKAGGAWNA